VKSIAWIGVCLLCSVLRAQTPAPPPAPAPSQTPAPTPTPAPPPPPNTPVVAPPEENIENMTSVALFHWLPSGASSLVGGAASVDPPGQSLVLPGKPSQANGITFTLRAKGPTRVELSLFDVRASGNTLALRGLSIFGSNTQAGDYIAMDYRLRNLKLTWNYLTYPVPSLDSKLRLKTLYEVHLTQFMPVLAFPFKVDPPVSSQQTLIYPAFGLGLEYVPSPKHFRTEIRFTGFGIPGHAALWDGEGSLVGRFGPMEIFAGEKAYHFRTSPTRDIYVQSMLWGPYGGVRWVFR
jgi:hypothetical protein